MGSTAADGIPGKTSARAAGGNMGRRSPGRLAEEEGKDNQHRNRAPGRIDPNAVPVMGHCTGRLGERVKGL